MFTRGVLSSGVISRRSFIVGTSAAAAGLLSACAGTSLDARPSSSTRLRILNWSDYIDDATIDAFRGANRFTVDYEPDYPGNDEAFSDLFAPNNGRVGYDIVVPTFWLASRLARRGWLEPIPLELVPNHVNLEPTFLTMPWDRGARYHMPWQAGLTGIAYNPRAHRPRHPVAGRSVRPGVQRASRHGDRDARDRGADDGAAGRRSVATHGRAAAERALDKLEAAKRTARSASSPATSSAIGFDRRRRSRCALHGRATSCSCRRTGPTSAS